MTPPDTVVFSVLGPVTAWRGGTEVDLGPPQQRAFLAVLLVQANRPVSLTEMVDTLWGDAPPPSAVNIIQRYAGRLRRLLSPGLDLERAGGGYRLHADPSTLDLLRFRQLLESAGLPQLIEALGLWRGPACAGIEPEVRAWPLFAALDGEHLSAVRRAADAALEAGRPEGVLPIVQTAAETHPLDESVQARLILLLSMAGRQAEALQKYQRVRERLTDELGVDPGPELATAHTTVLRQEAPLNTTVAPAQLPANLPTFTGRRDQIAELVELLSTNSTIAAISGMAGVGKTALAVHYAHQIASRFPDGQLYVNLRGFDPAAQALSPMEVLRLFLDALGVAAQRIPAEPDAATALYRSHLSGRRVLILLDNARDSAQVVPLLPGSAGCLVIVTSRHQMADLVATHGAHPLALDLLSMDEARDMLARRVGADRVAAEPAAVEEIMAACDRLPLALATVAAQAALNRGFPLSTVADELRRARGSLQAFAGPEAAIDARAVFSWSYRALSGDAARLLRLLALHPPGAEAGVEAVASLAGVGLARARAGLTELSRANLVMQPSPGRYTFHDLLRAYAVELVEATETDDERILAQRRLFDHYLYTAHAVFNVIGPSRTALFELSPLTAGACWVPPEKETEANDWLAREHPAMIAAVGAAASAGLDGHSWRLALSLNDFLELRGRWHEWSAVLSLGLAAAERAGDLLGQGLCRQFRGIAVGRLGDLERAEGDLGRAVADYAAVGDRHREAGALRSLGWLLRQQGRLPEALALAERALAAYDAIGNRIGQGNALNEIGWYLCLLGRPEDGLEQALRGLELLRETESRRGESATWDTLGYAYDHLGRRDEAIDAYRAAVRMRNELGDRYSEASSLTRLAEIHDRAGEPDAAWQAWASALAILADLGHPQASEVRELLSKRRSVFGHGSRTAPP